jgi:dUTP pyrophosphatase
MTTVCFKPCIENPPPPPQYQTEGSAGMDIHAGEDIIVWGSGGRALVRTGYEIEIPVGFEGQVRPRSGLALKNGVTVLNSPGTIDSDFRNELKVILINHDEQPFQIKKGDRIAQLVIAPYSKAQIKVVSTLTQTNRAGGFGSTGV